MNVVLLEPDQQAAVVGELAELLIDCVDGGASVGFLAPLARADAEPWWRGALSPAETLTFVARDDDGSIVGCVQLALTPHPTGRHRADLRKLLVHRRARGRGVATSLMAEAEREALARGRTVLLLDTESGSPAEDLYLNRGWEPFGVVTDHARRPDGRLAPTTFMVKHLAATPAEPGPA